MTPYPTTLLAGHPIAYWRFSELTGAAVADATGNGHDGVLSGGYTRGLAGEIAGDNDAAVLLDGGYVRVPDAAALRFGAGQSFSLEAIVRPNAAGVVGPRGVIGKWRTGQYNYLLGVNEGAVYFHVDGGAGSVAGPTLAAGQRAHIVAVADATAGQLLVYVDGALAAQALWSGANAPGDEDLAIGQNPEAADVGYDWAFRGTLDEAAVYNVALGAARVRAHHALGRATGSVAPPIGSSRIVVSSSTRSSR